MKLVVVDRSKIRKASAYTVIIRQAMRLPLSKAGELRKVGAEHYNAIKYAVKKMGLEGQLTVTKEGSKIVFMRNRKKNSNAGKKRGPCVAKPDAQTGGVQP